MTTRFSALAAVGVGSTLIAVACGGSFESPSEGGTDSPAETSGKMDVTYPDAYPDSGSPDTRSPDTGARDVVTVDSNPPDSPFVDVISFDTGPGFDVVPPDAITFDVIGFPDVITLPDVTTVCTPGSSYGGGSSSSCFVGTDYTCGVEPYSIQCDCPSAICTCKKGGATLPVAVSYKGCPSCGSTPFAMVAAACGIPY